MVPVLSESYKWTASAVAGRNAKVPIYILAEDQLEVCVHNMELPATYIGVHFFSISYHYSLLM